MKLVIQQPNRTIVEQIKEFQLEQIINQIKTSYSGEELSPLKYELFRYKLDKGIIVIYRDNRILRTKNSWYEIRCLTNLSRYFNERFLYSVRLRFRNNLETEIDGLDVQTKKIMVEIKNATITQEWIDFYQLKRRKLDMKECYIIAPKFSDNMKIDQSIRCFECLPDHGTLVNYYNNDFSLPSWFVPIIRWRHIRILLDNGRWFGVKRKLTNTAKHTPSSKLILTLNWLINKRNKYPAKIYYTLSPMLFPIDEYYGKGRPLSQVIAALDIDSNHQNHIIGKEGFCKKCLKEADIKAKILSDKLIDRGLKFIKLFSGFKGYHFYILDENDDNILKEMNDKKFQELIQSLNGDNGEILVDNANFKAKDGSFDKHRIFKLPNSLDLSTGILIKQKFEKLKFKDKFEEIL